MKFGEGGSCVFVDQPVAPFGGGAFGACFLARAIAELLSPMSSPMMFVGGRAAHGNEGTAQFPSWLEIHRSKQRAGLRRQPAGVTTVEHDAAPSLEGDLRRMLTRTVRSREWLPATSVARTWTR